jgi:formylglycine-generating enzyme required for sulfatase activity
LPAPQRIVRTVFLSSTARDLGPHREAVAKAILKLDDFKPVRMEDFGARDWEADAFCRAKVAACDVFVGLIGHLYGSSPEGQEVSFTEREYDAAAEAGIPRLLFLASDDLPLPPSLRESDEKWQRQLRFRERIRKERIVAFFDLPGPLATQVVAALGNLEREILPASGGAVSTITTVRVEGSGAAAVGAGSVAAGAGGVAVGGNVHGDIILGGSPDRSTTVAPSALRTTYLRRLYHEAASLSLLGIDPAAAGDGDAGLSLDAVYTALLTMTPRDDRLQPGASEERDRPLSALEQLNRHRHLVLLGDPGSGKSTFVNFVALCLAGEVLGPPAAGLDLLRSPLPDDDGDDEEEPQPWDHGALLPVRVVLRDFAAQGLPAVGKPAKARHLWDFIAGTLTEASLAGCADYLYKHLQETGGLILLDGLDEVPEAESRREQIRDVVMDFVKSFGKCRVLLTSRTYAYQNQGWKLAGFAEAVLAPFSDGQIRRFVSRWYAHSAALGRCSPADAEGKAVHLQEAIFGREHLRGLAERPLLLTLMACLHAWRGANLPEKREELYASAVELLLDRWESHRVIRDREGNRVVLQPSLGQYLEAGKEKVRQALEELAFEVHATQGDRPGTADVDQGDLVARLMRLQQSKKVLNPAELVEYLSQRAGLLVPRGVGVYTFPHRTFQEYLAACHLSVEDFPATLSELGRTDPDRWREVVLLAGAKAARGTPSAVWQLARELCFREPDDPDCIPGDAWGAHLAGQAIVETVDLSRRISEANRRQLDLLRRWHVRLLRTDDLPARERALTGKTLAILGDPRFDPDRWFLPREPLLGFVKVPAGPFLMGEGKEQHEVTLPAFFISRYPVTVAQFRSFVEESGYQVPPFVLEEVANHPVVYVSWHDGLAYCEWLTERLRELPLDFGGGDFKVALPSEAEWEKAARGVDGREYPWEDGPDPERANYRDTGIGEPSTVGGFPGGASPFGCEEMSGNVWEWTRSLYEKYPYPSPEKRRAQREDLTSSGPRVLRGGAFDDDPSYVRCAVRLRYDPIVHYGDFGFRVVLLPFSSDL